MRSLWLAWIGCSRVAMGCFPLVVVRCSLLGARGLRFHLRLAVGVR